MKLGAKVCSVAAIVAVMMSSPRGGDAQMKARVAWTSFASNMSGTWVAQEEGLFKKNGLEVDRKSTRLNSSHIQKSRMPSSA